MDRKPAAPHAALTREERLAAKLRENLHRRKAQARAADPQDADAQDADAQGKASLPKEPPKS